MADPLSQTEYRKIPVSFEKEGSFIFFVVLMVFLLILALYGGLYLLNWRQEKARQNRLGEVSLKEEDLGKGLIENILALDSRLKNIKKLLARHTFASNVFRFLEENTHPLVRFNSFDFNAGEKRINLGAEAASFTVVARQISILEGNPLVEKVEFGGLTTDSLGLVRFQLSIIFKDTLLRLKP